MRFSRCISAPPLLTLEKLTATASPPSPPPLPLPLHLPSTLSFRLPPPLPPPLLAPAAAAATFSFPSATAQSKGRERERERERLREIEIERELVPMRRTLRARGMSWSVDDGKRGREERSRGGGKDGKNGATGAVAVPASRRRTRLVSLDETQMREGWRMPTRGRGSALGLPQPVSYFLPLSRPSSSVSAFTPKQSEKGVLSREKEKSVSVEREGRTDHRADEREKET